MTSMEHASLCSFLCAVHTRKNGRACKSVGDLGLSYSPRRFAEEAGGEGKRGGVDHASKIDADRCR